jgi:hypothetical protein
LRRVLQAPEVESDAKSVRLDRHWRRSLSEQQGDVPSPAPAFVVGLTATARTS